MTLERPFTCKEIGCQNKLSLAWIQEAGEKCIQHALMARFANTKTLDQQDLESYQIKHLNKRH